MRAVGAAVVLWMLLAGTARAEEPAVEARAFVETVAPPSPVYAGQPFRLRLRVGYDRDWFESFAVPLFRQAMDVSVQVEASWLEALPGAAAVASTNAGESNPKPERLSLVVNGAKLHLHRVADEERDGRRFTVLEAERVYAVDTPREIAVSAPTLRFAYATRFEEDFVGGRVALDRRDVDVAGDALAFAVRALPEEGRPDAFVDAVGRFDVEAKLLSPEADADGVLRLQFVLHGEGNLATLTPPDAALFAGFHVFGVLDEVDADARVVTYDLTPLSASVREVPPIPFAFFDPAPGGYRVVSTDAIRLAGQEPEAETTPLPSSDDPEASNGRLGFSVVLGAVLGAVVVLLLGRRRAKRASAPADPDRERKAAALAALQEAIARADPDPTPAFAEFLAAHLGRPAAAAIAPDLPLRLVEAGVPVELAADAASTLERLVAARYGGGGGEEAALRLAELVDPLDAAFAPLP